MPFINRDKNKPPEVAPPIPHRSKQVFIGRNAEQAFFHEEILKPPFPTKNIISVSGDGGLGKTTLLARFVRLATRDDYRDHCVIAQVDEGHITPASIMKKLVEQLRNGTHGPAVPMANFEAALATYETTLTRFQHSSREFFDFDRLPSEDFGGFSGDGLPYNTHSSETGSNFHSYAKNRPANWHYRQLARDSMRLEPDPIARLTCAFVADLNLIAEDFLPDSEPPRRRKILLFFDTFERVSSEVTPWLLNILLKEDVPIQLVLIIAGRDSLLNYNNPADKWAELRDELQLLPLAPFSEEETRAYLISVGISDPEQHTLIYRQSKGWPFSLDFYALTPQESAAVNSNHHLVERLLKWIPLEEPHRRRLALDAALFTRPFTLDDLAAFSYIPPAERPAFYDWLISQPFILDKEQGHLYHDIAREEFARYQYHRSPTDYYASRRQLADYYHHRLRQLEAQSGADSRKTAEWRELAFTLLEQLFLLPDEPDHILAIETTMYLWRYDNSTQNKELLALLEIYCQHSQTLIGLKPTAAEIAKNLHHYCNREAALEEQFKATQDLLTKAQKFGDFPQELLAYFVGWVGFYYRKKQNYEYSLEHFTEAIKLDPTGFLNFYHRGVTYQLKEEYDLAIADFNRTIELDSKHKRAFAYRGEANRLKGAYDLAIADFNRAIELEYNFHWVFEQRGQTYILKREYDLAIADFNRAIELNSKCANAIAYRGETNRLRKKYNLAIADFNKALELAPDYEWAIRLRGKTYRQKGEYDLAIADFSRVINLDTNSHVGFKQRGEIYRQKGEYDLAIADFSKAIELSPECSNTIANRGETYRRKGDYNSALIDFSQAIELDSEYSWAIAGRGRTYLRKGDYSRALGDLNKAIELDSTKALYFVTRGELYWIEANYELALIDLNKALELTPEYSRANALRGEVYRLQGNFRLALANLNKALEFNPQDSWATAAIGLVYLDKLYLSKAQKAFKKATKIAKTSIWYKFRLVWIRLLDQKPDSVIAKQLLVIASLEPDDGTAFLCRSVAAWINNNLELAIAEIEQGMAKEPEDKGLHMWQGLYLLELGRDVEAEAALKYSLVPMLPRILFRVLRWLNRPLDTLPPFVQELLAEVEELYARAIKP